MKTEITVLFCFFVLALMTESRHNTKPWFVRRMSSPARRRQTSLRQNRGQSNTGRIGSVGRSIGRPPQSPNRISFRGPRAGGNLQCIPTPVKKTYAQTASKYFTEKTPGFVYVYTVGSNPRAATCFKIGKAQIDPEKRRIAEEEHAVTQVRNQAKKNGEVYTILRLVKTSKFATLEILIHAKLHKQRADRGAGKKNDGHSEWFIASLRDIDMAIDRVRIDMNAKYGPNTVGETRKRSKRVS
eukprot:TRINITY_DN11164_c0_g1_i3.p1 TRINITY_DN11164_c0_g1~~TRINITY_DN11164_c0_g1_i3.p1  ORF type:complete len:241 (+),score=14.93 TRINITY_DN11164_c0_g1_i3:298-1020(+)